MPDDSLEVLEQDPWPSKWPGAILPAEAIEAYSDPQQIDCALPLIEPYDRDLLRAARYELRLGDEAHVGGKPQVLDDDNRYIVLPPHQVAVVKTYEFLRVPRFLIARWSLRVTMVYEGLLWVGGPQVDPGWAGHLYSPIYNLAERDVYLRYKQPIFTMDFVRVQPTELRDKRFRPKRQRIEAHDTHSLKSALYEEVNRALSLEPRLNGALGIIFVILGVMIATIGALFASPLLTKLLHPGPVLVALVLTSLAVSFTSLVLVGCVTWPRKHR